MTHLSRNGQMLQLYTGHHTGNVESVNPRSNPYVTRASKLVVLCGTDSSVYTTVNNLDTQKRYSGLKKRIKYFKNI